MCALLDDKSQNQMRQEEIVAMTFALFTITKPVICLLKHLQKFSGNALLDSGIYE